MTKKIILLLAIAGPFIAYFFYTRLMRLNKNSNKSVYKVFILSSDKKRYSFIWEIERVVEEGDLKDCWMTISVSNPEYLGEVI